jgi:hypothetical protein
MAMMPIPFDCHLLINATLSSSSAKLQLLPLMLSQHLPGAGLPPAANAHQTPAHVPQQAHDPVAVIPRSSNAEIQTTAKIVNEIPGGLL